MKWQALVLILALALVFETSCKSRSSGLSEQFRVALVLDKGGVDDKSFNASAYHGAKRAESELGVDLKYVEVTDDAQIESTLKAFAKKNYDLILAIGFGQQTAVAKAAQSFPKSRFAIVDALVDLPNVASLMFMENEGSFLAGALASMKTKTHVVGFIGGMDSPLIRRFQLGYEEGAKYYDPKTKVIVNYVGTGGDSWANPTKAKELALSQIRQGADIIYPAAGASGLGVFDAVEETVRKAKGSIEVYAIGVDSNQNAVKPGLILTSMLKRVDVAVFETIKAAKENSWTSGRKYFGLKNFGIDLAIDENNESLLTAEMKANLNRLRMDIQTSKILVTDYYSLLGINK
jgi:basic membrane protein A